VFLAEAVLFAVLVLAASLAGRRVQLLLRRGGTEVVLRELPAEPGRGWRHGVLRYREVELLFFRVASLRAGHDRKIPRRTLVVLGRRPPDVTELGVVPPGSTVLRFAVDGAESEMALSGGALTAFLSWVESSPPGRSRQQTSG